MLATKRGVGQEDQVPPPRETVRKKSTPRLMAVLYRTVTHVVLVTSWKKGSTGFRDHNVKGYDVESPEAIQQAMAVQIRAVSGAFSAIQEGKIG